TDGATPIATVMGITTPTTAATTTRIIVATITRTAATTTTTRIAAATITPMAVTTTIRTAATTPITTRRPTGPTTTATEHCERRVYLSRASIQDPHDGDKPRPSPIHQLGPADSSARFASRAAICLCNSASNVRC